MMRAFLLIAAIAIIIFTIFLTQKKTTSVTPSGLALEIQAIQEKLPIKVDDFTTLKSVGHEGMDIHYLFLVVSDPVQVDKLNSKNKNFSIQVEHAVKLSACVNRNTKRYINSGVSLFYKYENIEKEELASFSIPAGYCD